MKLAQLLNEDYMRTVSRDEFKQLFDKYKFVPYFVWDDPEDGANCQVAVLTDIPANISQDKVKMLATMSGTNMTIQTNMLDYWTFMPDFNSLVNSDEFDSYFNGKRFYLHFITFKEWVEHLTSYDEVFGDIPDDFEDE